MITLSIAGHSTLMCTVPYGCRTLVKETYQTKHVESPNTTCEKDWFQGEERTEYADSKVWRVNPSRFFLYLFLVLSSGTNTLATKNWGEQGKCWALRTSRCFSLAEVGFLFHVAVSNELYPNASMILKKRIVLRKTSEQLHATCVEICRYYVNVISTFTKLAPTHFCHFRTVFTIFNSPQTTSFQPFPTFWGFQEATS